MIHSCQLSHISCRACNCRQFSVGTGHDRPLTHNGKCETFDSVSQDGLKKKTTEKTPFWAYLVTGELIRYLFFHWSLMVRVDAPQSVLEWCRKVTPSNWESVSYFSKTKSRKHDHNFYHCTHNLQFLLAIRAQSIKSRICFVFSRLYIPCGKVFQWASNLFRFYSCHRSSQLKALKKTMNQFSGALLRLPVQWRSFSFFVKSPHLLL